MLFTNTSLKCEHESYGLVLGQNQVVVPASNVLLCEKVL